MNGKLLDLKVLKVSELKNWDKNPREEVDLERLKEILMRRGQLMPLLVDGRDMVTVLGGNVRLKGMRELGWEEVSCSIVYPESDADAVEIALEDNEAFGRYIKREVIKLAEMYPEIKVIKIPVSQKPIGALEVKDRVRGESEFGSELLEENNYIVFFFNSKLDWEFVRSKMGIESVKSIDSKKGYEREGVNRVLDGKILVGLIGNGNSNNIV